MLPLTILAAQKIRDLLTAHDALEQNIAGIAQSCNRTVPAINSAQVILTSANPEMSDKNLQLTYPRICLYSNSFKNAQTEKFRAISGTVSVVAEVWASGNLIDQTDEWIHFYVEALTAILNGSVGDWGDGIFFSGRYDVQVQSPKPGGLGYVESAKVTCLLDVSRS